ncbi:hypothetical protein [Actinacidiphila rubida]|uniref:Uncharacterized protein n=1 Tax=Actinacidiphila rubida TaxID=310780 RepID=A0A1H8V3K3_9ACTN|nr:hypothetical protein [Actinacidiphila rubida]SEP09358.1 hypothetical protein SAMN05216267_10993 [Actinacidiphila rubida]
MTRLRYALATAVATLAVVIFALSPAGAVAAASAGTTTSGASATTVMAAAPQDISWGG